MSRRRRRLLDLFCGAGGAAMGYYRAGFEVIGVDVASQPHYPFEFHQADALTFPLHGFDAIHASPPCQHYSIIRNFGNLRDRDYPDLIAPTRERLIGAGVPYVIENVPGAPLVDPIQLCGSSFALPLRRHRLFESNVALLVPPCAHRQLLRGWRVPLGAPARHRGKDPTRSRYVAVYGSTRYAGELSDRRIAMGIDWMTNAEITQAIPPDYTELLGHQLLRALPLAAAAG